MKVLFCSYFKFPEGDAGAIRHEKLAYMFQELKHEVFVVGLGQYCGFENQTFNGIEYVSLREKKSDFQGKVGARLRYWNRLKKIMDMYHPDAVLMDDMRPVVTEKIKYYCRKHKVMLIHDSVEWYSPEQFRMGVLDISCIQKNIVNRYLIDKSCRVISISSYLHSYYLGKGMRSVNIPVVLADSDLCREKKLENSLAFMYAGQPGKKDNLHMIIEAFSRLPTECHGRFRLHILGCTKEQILASGISGEQMRKLEDCLEIHGRVPHDDVIELLKKIDFTLLMRSPVQRYAKAGFPTKVPESLSRSTPMITNLTSDLKLYLQNEYNALIVKDYTADALCTVLRQALDLPVEVRMNLCENAYHTASEKLSYTKFLDDLRKFLG